MTSVHLDVELAVMTCGECAGTYAVSEVVRKRHHRDGTGWHCPYCQVTWGYFGNGLLKKERERAEAAEKRLVAERSRHDQTRSELDHTERRRRAEKAAKTRLKNRAAAGVCPCCNRTFDNLARHMKSKHPDFGGPS